jgi:hypothetical protein
MLWIIGGIIVVGLCAAGVYAILSVAADCDRRARGWEERAKDNERRRSA